MASNTPNLGLLKKDPMVDGNETFNIETMLNENWDKVDEAVGRTGGYGVTTQPKANEYEVNLKPAPASLTAGIRVTVKVNVASTGAPMLNVNGLGSKPVLKTNGSSASFKQDGVYTLVYDGQAFILQGEGGEVGTATAADVLAPKTIGTDSGIVTGTIPTKGNEFKSGLWSNPDGDEYVDTYVDIDGGYYPPGTQMKIQVYDPNLVSNNIRADANVFGVLGKPTVVDTADAVLDPQYLLVGQSGYDDGVKKNGQMPNRSTENHHMPGLESTVWAGDRFFIRPPAGYYNGATWVTTPVPGLTPENLKLGVNVAGLVGTTDFGKKYFNRTYKSSSGTTQFNVDFGFNWHLLLVISDTNGHATCLLSRTLGTYKLTGGQYPPDISTLTFTGLTMYLNSAGGTYHVIAYEY